MRRRNINGNVGRGSLIASLPRWSLEGVQGSLYWSCPALPAPAFREELPATRANSARNAHAPPTTLAPGLRSHAGRALGSRCEATCGSAFPGAERRNAQSGSQDALRPTIPNTTQRLGRGRKQECTSPLSRPEPTDRSSIWRSRIVGK
eukprot:659477-Alexandrium_andersonii.AAC.1